MTFGQYGNQNRKFLQELKSDEPTTEVLRLCAVSPLPTKVDLREKAKVAIYNQGSLSSCTANALCTVYEIRSLQTKNERIKLSRLFLYYNERQSIGRVNIDKGARIQDGINALTTQGCCLEAQWPYDESKVFVHPPPQAYSEAFKHIATTNTAQLDPSDYVNQFKICLSQGLPVVCGIMVYESFTTDEVGKTGVIPMPNTQTEREVGGHALCVLAFDDETQMFTFQNSWGTQWGDKGYGQLPYSYIGDRNLTADCHVIAEVEIDKSHAPVPTPIPSPSPVLYPPYTICPYPHTLPCPLHSYIPYNPYNPFPHFPK